MTTTEAQAIRDAIAKHIILFRRSEFRLILNDDNMTILLTDGQTSIVIDVNERIKMAIDEDKTTARTIATNMVQKWAEQKYIVG